MQIDKVALYFMIAAFVVWAAVLLLGLVAAGSMALFALVPILAVAYLFGAVLSQRLKSRDDDYYDKIE